MRGADGVVVAAVTVVPPLARGVKAGLAELLRPAPTLLTARRLTVYVVPFVSPGIVTGVDGSAGESAVHVVPSVDHS